MKYLLRTLLVVALFVGFQSAYGQLKTIWAKSAGAGSLPAWFPASGNAERGLAVYGNKLYVASRTGGTHVYILDATTGDSLGQLNVTGVSGGTFAINDVEASYDGVIFACNLTTAASTSPFKVYKWASDTATPVVAISYNGLSGRLGDMITVVGAANNSTMNLYAAEASKDTVLKFTTADSGATFTPTVIKISSPASLGASASVAPYGAGGSPDFYVNGIGINPMHYNGSGTLLGTIPGSVLATGSSAIRFLDMSTRKFVVSFQGVGNANARIVDVTGGDSSAVTNVITPLLGSNANSNGTGDVELEAYGSDSVDVYVLGTNNGLAKYRTNLKQNDITFQVNMRVKILEGAFGTATDSVVVRGDFNGWSGNAALLTDANNDSIYTGTYNVGTGSSITFKYVIHKAASDGWEGDPNRTFDLTGNPASIALDYFDRDSKVSLPFNATFRVRMDVKFQEGTFNPATDSVVVRGNFNNWAGNAELLADSGGTKIYTGKFSMLGSAGDIMYYKFVLHKGSGDTWEDNIGGNRQFQYNGTDVELPIVYFDGDSLVSTPVSGNLLFTLDMSVFEQVGWFQRAQGDSVFIRGSFNGWGTSGESKMGRIAGTEQYELIVAYDGFSYDNWAYKYFMQLDTTGNINTRFPGYTQLTTAQRDGIQYDHPAERGDGNRQYVLPPGGGNIEAPVEYFSHINPKGILLSGTTVALTFQIDMRPATKYADAFLPATDSVFVLLQDALWRSTQGYGIITTPQIVLSDGNADTIYTGTINVHGPTHYNVMYNVRYKHADGSQVDEGGGLGSQNPYRSRFIQPTGPNTFPAAYSFPVEEWKHDPPLVKETAPFSIVVGVEPVGNGSVPYTYSLGQNYPNPFNPITTVNFSLAKDSHVTLRLYNLLGQEVVTVLNRPEKAGEYKVTIDGSALPSGVYFYRLEAGSFVDVKKMTLVK